MPNKEVILHFRKPGLLTTIQDEGRVGFQEYGVAIGGPMDHESASIANLLVKNPPGISLFEITWIGPEIMFEGDCQIALTGADLSARINDLPVNRYETISVQSGSVLSFGRPIEGCRTYLAVRGKWELKKWLGSASFASFGGETLTPNSKMIKNSRIRIFTFPDIAAIKYPTENIPEYPENQIIQVMPGPEFERFSHYEIASFFSTDFRLSNDSNRMGFRLEGRNLESNKKREIISSGIVPGTIQITRSGQPIILMTDAQTTGGYFRIANVIRKDLCKLAQLRPGGGIRFVLVR